VRTRQDDATGWALLWCASVVEEVAISLWLQLMITNNFASQATENMSAHLIFEATGATCSYEGASGMAQMLDSMNAVGRHDCLKKFRFVVHDLSNVTDFEHDDHSLVMTAAQMEACINANRNLKFAIVSDDVHGEIAGQLLSDILKRPLHVFKSLALAMVWVRSW
jgi:hypothetical protein